MFMHAFAYSLKSVRQDKTVVINKAVFLFMHRVAQMKIGNLFSVYPNSIANFDFGPLHEFQTAK